jgi:hypothetical protein
VHHSSLDDSCHHRRRRHLHCRRLVAHSLLIRSGQLVIRRHQDVFMFYRCCKSLERVSIRNVKYYYPFGKENYTQNALIKFVRNAPPTLRWLRSDLTPENMTMLRIERPGIELVN